MLPGERFKLYVDGLSAYWKDRLAGWTVDVAVRGVKHLFDDMEPELVEQTKGHLDTLRNLPGLPPETKRLLDSMAQPKSWAFVVPLITFLFGLLTPLIGQLTKGALEPARQMAEKATPFHIPDLGLVLDMRLRERMDDAEMYDLASRSGWSRIWTDRFMDLKHPTMPSEIALSGWLRDPVKYKEFVDRLPRLGLTAKDIELLTELAWRIPSVQDVIRYVVKEAYSPEIVAEFGQGQEYPAIAEADAAKAGVRPDHLLKEWISHWDLPSVGQGYEMMHRGEITEDQLTKLLKAKDIMPFWRNKLTAISWLIPGRIEARMLAQYGLVDKRWLVDLLEKDGMAKEYRDVVADMMLVRGARTDIQTRYSKKWLDAAGVKAEINKLNLSPQIADRLYQWIVTNAGPERTQTERDLTTAEIVKAVRLNYMTWAEGIALLMEQGWDETEADLKLAIGIPTAAEVLTDEQKITLDTIRRRRRQRLISREEEISALIALGLSPALANAHASNDDLRLEKVRVIPPPEVVLEYHTEDGKVKVATIRLSRRQRRISRDEEIVSLIELEMSDELAIAYADNDDLRLGKEPTEEVA